MRIHILGASGSGVTTLGKALAIRLEMSYFDSDDFFWERTEIPYSVKTDPSVRDRNVLKQLGKADNWILGGSIINWSPEIHRLFDLIVFLHIPQHIRMERLRTREYNRYGRKIEVEDFLKKKFEKFMEWAKDYDEVTGIANRNISTHKNWLEMQKASKLDLIGVMEVEEKMDKVLSHLKSKTV